MSGTVYVISNKISTVTWRRKHLTVLFLPLRHLNSNKSFANFSKINYIFLSNKNTKLPNDIIAYFENNNNNNNGHSRKQKHKPANWMSVFTTILLNQTNRLPYISCKSNAFKFHSCQCFNQKRMRLKDGGEEIINNPPHECSPNLVYILGLMRRCLTSLNDELKKT